LICIADYFKAVHCFLHVSFSNTYANQGSILVFLQTVAASATLLGHKVVNSDFFDTVTINVGSGQADAVTQRAEARGINLRKVDDSCVSIAMDETASAEDLENVIAALGMIYEQPFLSHDVRHSYREASRTLRIFRLASYNCTKEKGSTCPPSPSPDIKDSGAVKMDDIIAKLDCSGRRRRLLAKNYKLFLRHAACACACEVHMENQRPIMIPGCRRALVPDVTRAHNAVPHTRGLPIVSLGDGAAAVHEAPREQGPVAVPLDDSLGLVHDEAQRHGRDGGCDHVWPKVIAPAACVAPLFVILVYTSRVTSGIVNVGSVLCFCRRQFCDVHPFVPVDQTEGFQEIFDTLSRGK
jgi:hypothetical protein